MKVFSPVVVFLGVAWLAASAIPLAATAAERKPNFLFVNTDDQRWDAVGAVQGDRGRFPWFQTLHMDRLAAEEVRFRNAFVTMSLCAQNLAGDPARKALLDEMLAEFGRQSKAVEFRVADFADRPDAAAAPKERPNILLVHCHDLGQFLHCYGVKTVQTPNLDRLAAEGVRFSRSFCTAPGCSPSRASLFTGRWPHSNGVMGLCHGNFAWDLNPDERHLAQILREAGYATAAVGVVHETASGSKRCGYERYLPPASAKPMTDAAIELLREFRDKPQKPFFLCVGSIEPHRLAYPKPDWPGALPEDSSFPGPALKPDDSLGVDIPPYLRDTAGSRRELAGLQGAVRHVDAQFGRLMAALKDSGQDRNTLVIFTTDHGIAMPRAKASLYEPGVQVALLLRLPGRKGWNGGIVHPEMISNIDCVPTLLELVGVPVPDKVQGRSFAPLLDGKSYRPREEIFTELTYHDYYDPRRAVRTPTHKLIVNFSTANAFMDPSQSWRPSSDTVVPRNHAQAYHPHVELYDLSKDPWEQNDVAGRAEYAAIRESLLKRLQQHLIETKDPILQGAVTSPQHRRAVELLEGAARK